jgi:hypothetical protein
MGHLWNLSHLLLRPSHEIGLSQICLSVHIGSKLLDWLRMLEIGRVRLGIVG